MRSRESMLKGGESGPVLVPGDPENSLILKRLVAEEMPPRKRLIEASVKPMTASEIQLLRAWIQAGAPETAPETAAGSQKAEGKSPVSEQDRQFWAFQPPGDFPVPDVQHSQRSRNPIDAFILQKLEANELSLSPEADRRTLIRRATFD